MSRMRILAATSLLLLVIWAAVGADAACTSTAPGGGSCGGNVCCPSGQCCSQWGYCGIGDNYCGAGCQNSCPGGGGSSGGNGCTAVAPSGGSCGGGVCCPSGQCCSQWGYCGTGPNYCGAGCLNSCSGGGGGGGGVVPKPPPPPPPPPTGSNPNGPSSGGLAVIYSQAQFDAMFVLMRTPGSGCCKINFLTYQSFLTAAAAFPAFATSRDAATNKRELAAFLGQASQETTGASPNGPWTGGLCFLEEGTGGGGCAPTPLSLCEQSPAYSCNPSVSYRGRGPLQLSYNYNYIPAGQALGFDGLNNPGAVLQDPVLAWKTSLYFWMTARDAKPSCHDVIIGAAPSEPANGRVTGSYGWVSDIINGYALQCGVPGRTITQAETIKINYYKTFCDMFGVSYGPSLDCGSAKYYQS